MPSEIQKRMRFLREQKGESQETVAKFLNIKRNTYASQENTAKQVKDEIIEKLASYYKVSASYIRYGQQEENIKTINEPDAKTKYNLVLSNNDIKIMDMYKCLPPKARAKHRDAIMRDYKFYNKAKDE